MRLALAIAAIRVQVPQRTVQRSLLGTVSHRAYNHLFEPAGEHSRPPTVPRGATTVWCDEYLAPAAGVDERVGVLASRAVGAVLEGAGAAAEQVRRVIHVQCTLDQQILDSACLRIMHEHLPGADSAFTIGQVGTAGVPIAFRLAALGASGEGLACVSASDKWMAPFVRRVPELVTYGDAAGACLVGTTAAVPAPVAVIEGVVTSCRPASGDLWTAAPGSQRQALFEHVRDCAAELLRQAPDLDRSSLLLGGDGYGEGMLVQLAETLGAGGGPILNEWSDTHLSSASPLVAVCAAVGKAAARGAPQRALIWTGSPAGHAGAFLVRCSSGAVEKPGGWASAAPPRATDRQ